MHALAGAAALAALLLAPGPLVEAAAAKGAAEPVKDLASLDEFRARDAEGFDYLLHRASLNTLPAGKASTDAGVAADTVEPTLILLMANSNYKDVLFNFIWILETRFDVYNYGIACMDEEIHDILVARNIGCYQMVYEKEEQDADDAGEGGGKRQTVRMELMLNLLRAGVNVLHNDVDAVWRSDLRLDFQQADITGQRDQSPPDLREKWGSTFCTGTLFLRSCEQTVSFMEAVLNNTALHTFLDQRMFNHGLEGKTNGGVTWLSPPESLAYRSKDSTGDVSRGVCKGWRDMTVALLPQDPYRRECTGNRFYMRTAKVIHCNSSKRGAEKEDMLRGHEAWELPPGFEKCFSETGRDQAFSRVCADKLQQSYKAIRAEWCLDFLRSSSLLPRTRGPYYDGPLYGDNDADDRFGSPWGKARENEHLQKKILTDYGLGDERGCEAVLGSIDG